MKYYLVNFLVFHNNTITEDNTIALTITMDAYDCTNAFKKQIGKQRKYRNEDQTIVIKTYKQISEDIYLLVHPFIKENRVPDQQEIDSSHVSYKFHASNYSK
jgi:hypothetical protein